MTTPATMTAPYSIIFRIIPLAEILPHPQGRTFDPAAEEDAALLESFRHSGVVCPLLVRQMPDGGFQTLDGHRRLSAARLAGIAEVPCNILVCSSTEALENLLMIQLHSRPSGFGIMGKTIAAAAAEYFLNQTELAGKVGGNASALADMAWLLELPQWVRRRIDLAADDPKRLSIGAGLEILKCPKSKRAEAIKIVINPEWQEKPLSAEQARETLKAWIIEPEEARLSWEYRAELLVDALKAEHAEKLRGLEVKPAAWGDCAKLQRDGVDPFHPIDPSFLSAAAPQGACWRDVAVRYGIAAFAIPDPEDSGRAMLRIAMKAIKECECSAREVRQPCWLRAE